MKKIIKAIQENKDKIIIIVCIVLMVLMFLGMAWLMGRSVELIYMGGAL